MSLPKEDAAVLSARWTEGVLLKRDVFSTVERGRFRGETDERDAVLRRLDQVPWWSFLLARHLFARERKALTRASGLEVGPELLWAGRRALVRGFIDGVAHGWVLPDEIDEDGRVIDEPAAAARTVGEIEQAARDRAVDLLAGH